MLTIKEHWNLIGREPFLAITWEPDFCKACRFCRILMTHKNFLFKQIPDKTNDVTFLKNPQNPVFRPVLNICVNFCSMGSFSKKSGSVTHTAIYESLTPC